MSCDKDFGIIRKPETSEIARNVGVEFRTMDYIILNQEGGILMETSIAILIA